MRLNNKGQALVMFVLIIPIILLVLVLIYDIGSALYEKVNGFTACAFDARFRFCRLRRKDGEGSRRRADLR